MNINATLLVQMLTFALFIFITMRYVWPPLMRALHERQQKIADGLAAAERGVHELELSQHKALELLRDAKIQAADILEQANKRAGRIVDEAKERAREEGERLIDIAKAEIAQEIFTAKQELHQHIGKIAVLGAEKILQKQIDSNVDEHLLQQLIAEI